MPWILGILGALFGAAAADADRSLFGLLAGSAIGGLLGAHVNLRKRFDALAVRLDRLARAERLRPEANQDRVPVEASTAAGPASDWPSPAAPTPPPASPPPRSAAPPPPLAEPRPADLGNVLAGDAAPEPTLARSAHAIEPTLGERITPPSKRWLFEGNLPVKIGAILIFLGVGYLLKLAADEGWFALPIEFRYLGVATAALGALAWGWMQRSASRRSD